MADNDGVTQLLKAEAEANKIIQQAHEERYYFPSLFPLKTLYRQKELKKAKAAAEQEIEEFRKQEEQRYQQEIKKVLICSGNRLIRYQ